MNKPFFPMMILLLLSSSLFAQPNKRVGPALSKFLNTEFMVKYRDLRIEAESAAIGVQSRKEQMNPEVVFRLRTAYDQTATRANQLLEGIKQDFLNSKKLKSIAQFPDMYADGLRYKLQALSDFYAANFQQTMADAAVENGEEIVGSAVLLLVVELIGLTKGLTNYFAAIKREARQYTEAHLQEHLVQPYRWRYWDELSGSVSPYEHFEKSTELNMNPIMEDPLDHQLQKMNQAIQNLPIKEKEQQGYYDDFTMPADSYQPNGSNSNFEYQDWSPTVEPEKPTDDRTQKNISNSKKPAPQPAKPLKNTAKPSPKPNN